ncbi:non-heme iron oxygenase ferredoxin subunit [Herbiconiux ginsengi]|uniref:3-phenylpropionate/trans-cinnamate dioxygenase ferredoxin subunit n=1 Tax=Herbiconiux ginsengi TaxID=381665 RepID=A0A1H3U295_9MICO|nr:non-heme iron oxygenase ferredoxin subunit [Herbiconiux ginsengi]SDZ56447.1 3-phenylpropionate/trans-cinnamate dioxygenase ferredoxin subunit [Herbiconiux ginsengi]
MSSQLPELTPVCDDDDLRSGQLVRALIPEGPVLVVRDEDGVIRAVDDTCTHAEISLADGFVEGRTVECWAHGARFDLATGAALTLPASEPLRVREVLVHAGTIYIRSTDTGSGLD